MKKIVITMPIILLFLSLSGCANDLMPANSDAKNNELLNTPDNNFEGYDGKSVDGEFNNIEDFYTFITTESRNIADYKDQEYTRFPSPDFTIKSFLDLE